MFEGPLEVNVQPMRPVTMTSDHLSRLQSTKQKDCTDFWIQLILFNFFI